MSIFMSNNIAAYKKIVQYKKIVIDKIHNFLN